MDSLPAQTAHKAHASALAMLAFQIVLAVFGVTDVSPAEMTADLNELGQGILTLIVPSIVTWLATFYVPNKPKAVK